MDHNEARQILRQELMKYRTRSYIELIRLVGADPPTLVIQGASGTEYQIEIHIHWDGKDGGDVYVIGSIDDGGWRAFLPLTEHFIARRHDVISASW